MSSDQHEKGHHGMKPFRFRKLPRHGLRFRFAHGSASAACAHAKSAAFDGLLGVNTVATRIA